jgi:hypothetical protein
MAAHMLTSEHHPVVDVQLLPDQVAACRQEEGALPADGSDSFKEGLKTTAGIKHSSSCGQQDFLHLRSAVVLLQVWVVHTAVVCGNAAVPDLRHCWAANSLQPCCCV